MKYGIVSIVLTVIWTALAAEDIENLSFDPDHRNLNNSGQIEISFDLPDRGSIEKAYLEVTIGGTTTVIPGTETDGSDLKATGNTMTLEGADLYDLAGGASAYHLLLSDSDTLLSDDPVAADDDAATPPDNDIVPDTTVDTEIADEETVDTGAEPSDDDAITVNQWPSERDGQYTLNLVVVVDHDNTTDADADADLDSDDDSDLPDDDFAAARFLPVYGSGTETREPFTVALDNVPPAEPEEATVEGGNKKLIVTVTPPQYDAAGTEDEITGTYHARVTGLFLKEGSEQTASLEYTIHIDAGDRDNDTVAFTLEGKNGYSIINNDAGNDTYAYTIRIWAEDLAGNTDATRYIETTGSAVTTEGFWTHYKSAGGHEDGGYCFIATAGYGSYAHPHVKVLRAWRDTFLSTSTAGRAFISFYYHNGPRLAEWISSVPFGRPAVQLLLFPLVVLAWLMLHPLLLAALLAIYLVPFRRLMARRHAALLSLLIALILPAFLQAADEESGKEDQKKDEEKTEIHGDFFFAGGFYDPSNIDKSAHGSPFAEIVTSDLNFLPTLHAGIDIPAGKHLKLTPHAGIGFVELKGRAMKLDGTRGSESTYLYVLPLMAELKLRPVYEFPVRPYIAGGFDYYIWWIVEDGHLAMDGGKFGFHGSAGIQISLNFIDPKTAIKLREATGIVDTALFAHYRLEQVDNFGDNKSFDLSSSRFEFGILFDF